MYLNHFNLTRTPFHITPDPYFFYLSPSHKEAFASMIYGFKNKKGFVAVIGEVGLGKTTVLRTFLEQYGKKSKIKTIFVFNANVSFKGLLKIIYAELGKSLPKQKVSKHEMKELFKTVEEQSESSDEIFEFVQDLHSMLIDEYKQGTNVILVIDEAQNMPVQTLENLRMLSNLETTTDKLLQIFLIGQPELEDTLNKKELRQLKQRIAIRAILKPLTHKQTLKYIEHRLKKAGAEKGNIFNKKALKTIYKLSKGTPRRINILCDNVLITAFGYGKTVIGSKIIKEVNEDLEGRSFHPKKSLFMRLALPVLILIVASTALLLTTPLRHQLSNFFQENPILSKGLTTLNQWTGIDFASSTSDKRMNSHGILEKVPNDTDNQPKKEIVLPKKTEFNVSSMAALPVKSINSTRADIVSSNNTNTSLESNNTNLDNSNQAIAVRNGRASNSNEQISMQQSVHNNTKMENKTSNNYSQANFHSSKSFLVKPNDYETIFIESRLETLLPFFSRLSPVRQRVLVEMTKQTSIPGLLTFKHMLAALKSMDFEEASRQMLQSHWGRRVGDKAQELAQIMINAKPEALNIWLEKYYG
jgi:general secretion pathway protein A